MITTGKPIFRHKKHDKAKPRKINVKYNVAREIRSFSYFWNNDENRITIYVLTQRPSLNLSSKQIITNESHHVYSETKLRQETGTGS